MTRARLLCGDVRALLAALPDRSVQMCLTSPPYWGLRDYGQTGQLGLERTPEEYVANMVGVFREVRRVLREDGCLWLNLGDSYAANRSYQVGSTKGGAKHSPAQGFEGSAMTVPDGLKPKDLVGIPWRTAFALQADGWYLRSDIIWAKPNPMPESVTDRPTKAHEYLFLLTKSERYYYDAEAIKEENAPAYRDPAHKLIYRNGSEVPLQPSDGRPQRTRAALHAPGVNAGAYNGQGRNARTVWTIATQPYSGAHFATFPEELARRCILAGSSNRACEHCGAPWERVTDYERLRPATPSGHREVARWDAATDVGSVGGRRRPTGEAWQPTCHCENTGTASSVVLDCFGGSGTTAAVAVGHGRQAIHLDLNPAYIDLARERIGPMLCDEGTPDAA